MNAILLTPVIFSALLLGAHFLRAGFLPLVLLSLAFPLLLLIGRMWAVRLVQVILVLGALEWVRTTLSIIDDRRAVGQSWTVAAIILGLVAVFTAASALVFFSRSLKGRFSPGGVPVRTGDEQNSGPES
jgi:hypothetical protein